MNFDICNTANRYYYRLTEANLYELLKCVVNNLIENWFWFLESGYILKLLWCQFEISYDFFGFPNYFRVYCFKPLVSVLVHRTNSRWTLHHQVYYVRRQLVWPQKLILGTFAHFLKKVIKILETGQFYLKSHLKTGLLMLMITTKLL